MWHEGNVSPEYGLVEQLAGVIPGVLLLTATPEQLGQDSHFARLRLLDPNRLRPGRLRAESENYRARWLRPYRNCWIKAACPLKPIKPSTVSSAPKAATLLAAVNAGDAEASARLWCANCRYHGTGRVLFVMPPRSRASRSARLYYRCRARPNTLTAVGRTPRAVP